ncbi:hypothetical protein M5K25_025973 [Dendrobium thyrsiflorum]|uniref:Uncharacterized protein n=1 Tax=Dendrobium thyrsiflorum TaxID=117978 RepID=A0ABD0TWB8_DENTH
MLVRDFCPTPPVLRFRLPLLLPQRFFYRLFSLPFGSFLQPFFGFLSFFNVLYFMEDEATVKSFGAVETSDPLEQTWFAFAFALFFWNSSLSASKDLYNLNFKGSLLIRIISSLNQSGHNSVEINQKNETVFCNEFT